VHPTNSRSAVRRERAAVRVSVDAGGAVQVVLPRRVAEREAVAAVIELRPWIERRRTRWPARTPEVARPPGTVPFLGETLDLVRNGGRARVHRRGQALLVPAGDDAAPALERFYRRAAGSRSAPASTPPSPGPAATYSTLTIRGQRTRWASCSSTGAMSFNWRLLLAPTPVLDYVVEHEVCHLEVLDHSPRFWALMEERVPDWRDHAAGCAATARRCSSNRRRARAGAPRAASRFPPARRPRGGRARRGRPSSRPRARRPPRAPTALRARAGELDPRGHASDGEKRRKRRSTPPGRSVRATSRAAASTASSAA
jgi:predicted metal-dependent hydrolase